MFLNIQLLHQLIVDTIVIQDFHQVQILAFVYKVFTLQLEELVFNVQLVRSILLLIHHHVLLAKMDM